MKETPSIIRDLGIQVDDANSYGINSESLFLHVGSDLGRPEVHVTCDVGCRSHGVCWGASRGDPVLTAELIKFAIVQ